MGDGRYGKQVGGCEGGQAGRRAGMYYMGASRWVGGPGWQEGREAGWREGGRVGGWEGGRAGGREGGREGGRAGGAVRGRWAGEL